MIYLSFQFSNLIPDYVVTGPDFGRKGPGGYLCAGFYGNQWQFRPDSASCVCAYQMVPYDMASASVIASVTLLVFFDFKV